MTLVLGGVRSGKSAFAEKLVRNLDQPTWYLATGQVTDAQMYDRIRRHRQTRPAAWTTLEEPLEPGQALASALGDTVHPRVVLIDSLDTWVSNLLLKHESRTGPELESFTMSQVDQLLLACQHPSTSAVMVSSEVGLSLVPPNELGRRFQDLQGLVNQRVAAAADQVYLIVAGIPVEIKNDAR
ncbi:MAG TPA: bifunctional adenosylcobinamide kinase/adenosylcobinamide-phosphate guanylyltransferase [Dehalococcoidia bacterium]|nr:bifunctional adenosylcobinamide kinase/adenosylcobinamide-phosphate guanylyltransferase [Dehalococcoidia bacterium]